MACKDCLPIANRGIERSRMKKEEYSSIAKNLQNISDGTLSIERTQTGENIGKTFFTE
jgi:hypothetical protein